MCWLCGPKSGRVEGETRLMLERGDQIVVFEHIPAMLCDVCGDATLEADVARQLERLANAEFGKGAKFEWRTYVPA